ncbi:hypothetical protein [Paenibacillus residui]|uniref:Uncharacterized protein n=1 Tax=Paenibacillus residui TaxID=629724 RepID=A0ABW3DF30_9BACL
MRKRRAGFPFDNRLDADKVIRDIMENPAYPIASNIRNPVQRKMAFFDIQINSTGKPVTRQEIKKRLMINNSRITHTFSLLI